VWWKIGIGAFLLFAFFGGGELRTVFIALPIGLSILVGSIILWEKIFKIDPMESSSTIETIMFAIFGLTGLALAFWVVVSLDNIQF